jgi:hypothetical protein
MFFNNLRHIESTDLRVPDAVRVNQDSRADGAKTDRTAIRENDAPLWVLAFLLFAKQKPALY